jgi:hypothetical protein
MKNVIFSIAALVLPFFSMAQYTVDFENVAFPMGQNYWNGSDESGNFTIGGATFNNSYNAAWMSWSGFAISSEVDVTTAGWGNQYSCFAGSWASASTKFALWYANGEITFSVPTQAVSMMVTNTTYAALSMRDGDDYAKQFGGIYNADGEVDGTNGKDWFRLTITGMDADDEPTGTIDFYLADFRSDDSLQHFILDVWEWIDLTSLGTVQKLVFELQSSDVGEWGMNTPGYFALDNLIFYQSSASLNQHDETSYVIYPNPAQNSVNIKQNHGQEFSILLMDAAGNLIQNYIESETHILDLSALPNGVYFIQMTSGNGVNTERIVVTR